MLYLASLEPCMIVHQAKYNTSSLTYSLVQDNTQQTQRFNINPQTGAISLVQTMSTDTATAYVVSRLLCLRELAALLVFQREYFK